MKFLFRNSLSKWPPTPTTTTSTPPLLFSRAQTFGSGNRRWGTSSSPSTSGALLPVLLAAHDLWRQSWGLPPLVKPSFKPHGMRTPSKCRASLALAFLRCSVPTLVRHVPRPGLTSEPDSVPQECPRLPWICTQHTQ